MEMQMEINDLGLSPSFSCYFSDSLTATATAAAKVSREFIHEQQSAKFHEFSDLDEEDDFEFSQVFDNDNEKQVFSGKQISVNRGVGFPVGELDTVNIQIRKLFVNDGEASSFSNSSSSSSESEIESNNDGPSGSFCMWRPKPGVVSPILTKCKESNSGSGSRRRWRRILDLIRRSNGGSIFFSRSNKKIKASKQKNRKVSPVELEASRVAGKLKSSAAGSSPPSFHEVFYARKRAEREGEKMKSFLPYRLGFFVNINRIGSKKSTTF